MTIPKQRNVILYGTVAILFTSLLISGAAIFAGQLISATSTVEYQNSAGESMPTVTSNTVVVTVGHVAGVSLQAVNTSIELQPGETVSAPIAVTNTGSTADNINLSCVAAPSDWVAKLIRDDNSDGVRQPTETTEISESGELPAGAEYRFFLEITAPETAMNEVVEVNVTATSTFDSAVSDSLQFTATAAVSPYITSWLINGPYPNSDTGSRLTTDYLGGEALVSPIAGQVQGGRVWTEYYSPSDMVNLEDAFGPNEYCAGYAFAYIYSTIDQSGQMLVGSDDGLRVWLNGQVVWTNDVYRPFQFDQDSFPISFTAGWNKLLVKVTNGRGRWSFSAAICDSNGFAMPGLTVALWVPDDEPPVISDIQVSNVGHDTATVSWLTDKPVTGTLTYSSEFSNDRTITIAELATSHAVTLTGLAPETHYIVDIVCTDVAGNTAEAVTEFTTAAQPETPVPAPLITEWIVNGYYLNSDRATRLTADYIGDEANVRPAPGMISGGNPWVVPVVDSLSRIELHHTYGTPEYCAGYAHTYVYSPYQQNGIAYLGTDDGGRMWINGNLVWENDVYRGWTMDQDVFPITLSEGWNSVLLKITNGRSAWRFTLRIGDSDGMALPGVVAAVSIPIEEPPIEEPPVISDIQVSNVGHDTATVSWMTDKPASGRIEFSAACGDGGVLGCDEFIEAHIAVITGLTPGTDYSVKIVCTDAAGNKAEAVTEFTTAALPEVPVISDLRVTNVGHDTATISWMTDKPVTGTLTYSSEFSSDRIVNIAELATSHTITLTGLAPETRYAVEIVCTDAAGNTAEAVTEFTTAAQPEVTVPAPIISEWIVNGYYLNSDRATRLATDYIGDEANVRPAPGMISGGNPWIFPVIDYLGRIELHETYGTPEYCAGYAHTYVYSPYQQEAVAYLGTDDGGRMWINGNLVWENDVYRGWRMDHETFPITLSEGWNSILLKITNGRAAWRFTLRIGDSEGMALPGLMAVSWIPGDEPLVISDVQVSDVGPDTATISWTTNKPATGKLNYSTECGLEGLLKCTELISEHRAILTGLIPGANHFAQIICTDVVGNTTKETTEFTSEPIEKGPAPIISEWIVNGYYLNSDRATRLATDYIGDEANVRPAPGMISGGNPWIFPVIDYLGRIELHETYGTPEYCAGYAHTYVYSPREQDAIAYLGTDDGGRMWINGNLVWENDVYRGWRMDHEVFPITLSAGWNSVLLKITNGRLAWRFTLRIGDSEGMALPGVAYTTGGH